MYIHAPRHATFCALAGVAHSPMKSRGTLDENNLGLRGVAAGVCLSIGAIGQLLACSFPIPGESEMGKEPL